MRRPKPKPRIGAPRETRSAVRKRGGSGRPNVSPSRANAAASERRKLVTFDAATWQALDVLAHDGMKEFQELADEAFRDLLKKHGRPTDLKAALRGSLGTASNKARR